MLSSAEVGTLITALGCGIGREEFNIAKLRYHRIIIMTDADVDGSHIRTLLLTFFYRQMPELIENGYIYIAQPPLYKLKKGKQERYVKDDAELNVHLLSNALDGAELHVNTSAPPLSGQALEALTTQHMQVMQTLKRIARRMPYDVLEKMITMPGIDDSNMRDGQKMTEWFGELNERLKTDTARLTSYEITMEQAADDWTAKIEALRHGITNSFEIDGEFFESGEYKSIKLLGEELDGLLSDDAYIQRGDKQQAISSFKECVNWLLEEAKKGQHIQRYKGLGEMNPEQLWETTLDAAQRTLLQVQIEDAIGADEIFTTLMGDQVEPRREFIESNALNTSNLDV